MRTSRALAVTTLAFLLQTAVVILRAQPLEALGEPSIITRDYVQEELRLSDDQKQKLQKQSPDYLKVSGSPEMLWGFVKEVLNPQQFKRFQQLELQHEGPPALLRPQIANELKITDEQRNQFIGLIHDLQKTIAPLMKESQSGGNPEEIRPKIIKMRQDCLAKMEVIMSGAQKRQWEEMLGTPFDTLRHH